MTWENDDSFGDLWDLGGSVVPDLISYPIQKIIARDALRDGIDINTPFKKVASFGASAFLGTVGGFVAGPLGAVAMGLMGYCAGLAAETEEERERRKYEQANKQQMKFEEKRRLAAFSVAIGVLKKHVSSEKWSIMRSRLDNYADNWSKNSNNRPEPRTVGEIMSLLDNFEAGVFSIVNDIDRKANTNFMFVYYNALEEL